MSNDTLKFFRPTGDYTTDVHLDWLGAYTRSGMAEGFKAAADRIVDSCEENAGHPDVFLYPVAFLYRHYLELQLKNIILIGAELAEEGLDPKATWGHDLKKLWATAKKAVFNVWPGGDPNELKVADVAVAEFSVLDFDGQCFRYFEDAKGNTNLKNAPRIICLGNLQSEMNAVFDLLTGIETGMRDCLSTWREERASYPPRIETN